MEHAIHAAHFMDRVLDPLTACLNREAAMSIIDLRIDPEIQARVEVLAERANEGTLTPDEQVEYLRFVEACRLLAIFKLQAKRLSKSTACSDGSGHEIRFRSAARRLTMIDEMTKDGLACFHTWLRRTLPGAAQPMEFAYSTATRFATGLMPTRSPGQLTGDPVINFGQAGERSGFRLSSTRPADAAASRAHPTTSVAWRQSVTPGCPRTVRRAHLLRGVEEFSCRPRSNLRSALPGRAGVRPGWPPRERPPWSS